MTKEKKRHLRRKTLVLTKLCNLLTTQVTTTRRILSRQNPIHSFFFFFFLIRMLFFQPRLNILIFLPILG